MEQGREKGREVPAILISWGRKWPVTLTDESSVSELKRFGCVETGKGDKMEASIHGIVHPHHTDVPVRKRTLDDLTLLLPQ